MYASRFSLASSYSRAAIFRQSDEYTRSGLTNQIRRMSWRRQIGFAYVYAQGFINQKDNQNWHSGNRIKARTSLSQSLHLVPRIHSSQFIVQSSQFIARSSQFADPYPQSIDSESPFATSDPLGKAVS